MQVTAKSNIKHDGQKFQAGDTFEVSDVQAKALLDAGVIENTKALKSLNVETEEETDFVKAGDPTDKKAEEEGVKEVAGLPVDKKMKKEKLRGIALAMGLEVDKTMTGPEIYDMIAEARGTKDEGNDEGADAGNGESATHGAVTGGETPVPANPGENAPAQNTTDTVKEPAPAPAKPSKSK